MSTNLIKATIWSSLQRFGSLAISFVSNMVLARLLCPEDFGLVAFIMIFVGIADVLVDGGLGNALIQKKDLNKQDIQTVSSLNLILSIIFILIVYISAPAIEETSAISNLCICLRVQSLTILLKAFYVVPFSLMNRDMEFRKIAYIGLIANALATVLAIATAYCGWSYWSLIFRNIFLDVIFFYCYYRYSSYNLSIGIYKESFFSLFYYGFYVAIANIMEYLYSNLISFIVGKKYSVKELGYYQQAYSLQQIPVFSLSAIINQVFLPFLSHIQDDKDMIKENIEKTMTVVTFFIYPVLVYMMIFASPIITLLYSEKWLPCVPLFQIICVSGFFNALMHLCRSVLKAIGETRALFYIQLITVILGVLLVLFFAQFEMRRFVIVVAINGMVSYVLVGIVVGHYININIIRQALCFLPNLIISIVTGFFVQTIFKSISFNAAAQIITSVVLFTIVYLSIHSIAKTKGVCFVVNRLKSIK